jgi:predicted phosphoribosyltransferase
MEYDQDTGPRYRDRQDAGRVLASRLEAYKGRGWIVLAVPNGGVSVAVEIAEGVAADLYLMIVRKLQIPTHPEAGFGAVTPDGFLLLNEPLMDRLGLGPEDAQRQKEKALQSIRERQGQYGSWADLPDLAGRSVILVDDGLASGFTMEAAVRSAGSQGAERIVVAVPTASMSAHRHLETLVERIVCPDLSRLRLFAVANAYENWNDVEDKEVMEILERFSKARRKP